MVEQSKAPPKVLISYSHDSHDHKMWVGGFASKLVEKGVDVVLDQWDLGLGDDVPKFMEHAIALVDRVLMICTESYVRKANDGKGGVGYETMIVTGELVKDLGTAKFIPVVRQTGSETQLPRCVSTRFYANFSEGQNIEEQFDALLREIHNVPKIKKPALGKNPFTQSEIVHVNQGSSVMAAVTTSASTGNDFTKVIYHKASESARNNDFVIWRRILKEARTESWNGLSIWREKYNAKPPKTTMELPEMVNEAFAAMSPLFSVALAGIESTQDKFKNQIGIIDELIAPPKWNQAGTSYVVDIPDAFVFLYQALHGAICMETGQMDMAVQMARSQFQRPQTIKREPLIGISAWTGWPASLGENCSDAWKFLCALPDHHPWLLEIFGNKEDYLIALSAYYSVLNVIELSSTIVAGFGDAIKKENFHPDVPLCGFSIPRELVPRAYRLLTRDLEGLKEIWELSQVSTAVMAQYWPDWISLCIRWLSGVYGRSMFSPQPYHKALFNEPGLKPMPKSVSNRVDP